MECLRCKLRFNSTSRKPYYLPCLHNVCHSCLTKIQYCLTCKHKIYSNNSVSDLEKAKLNKSILELVSGRGINYDKSIKICVLGNSQVGKSSVVNLLKGLEFNNQHKTTIGYQYSFFDKNIRQNVIRYQLWDTAGDSKYMPSSQLHLKDVDIFLIVYDLSMQCQKNQVQKWLKLAEKHSKQNSLQKWSGIILIGNKVDLIQKLWAKIVDKNYQNVQISCSDEYDSIKQSPQYLTIWNKIQQAVTDNLLIKQEDLKVQNQIQKQMDKISISTNQSVDLQTQKQMKNDNDFSQQRQNYESLQWQQYPQKNQETLTQQILTSLNSNMIYSRLKDRSDRALTQKNLGFKRFQQVKRSF